MKQANRQTNMLLVVVFTGGVRTDRNKWLLRCNVVSIQALLQNATAGNDAKRSVNRNSLNELQSAENTDTKG